MKYSLLITITITMALSGCATYPINTFHPFQEKNLNPLIETGKLLQKTDTFFVITDSSSSMSDTYSGSEFPGTSAPTKFAIEKELLERINKTIPNITLSSGLRSFGFGHCLSYNYTELNQIVKSHIPSEFSHSINTLKCSGGGTPIASAFEAALPDLTSAPGNIGVILLSDGHNYEISPDPAVTALKEHYGDKLCIYTVWVGNNENIEGQAVLQSISDMSGCGFSTTVKKIASSSGMANFVSQVFFKPAPDTDGDGIPDSRDNCPNTPKGTIVDKNGCWAFHGVLFDYDKSTIKPEYKSLFDNAIQVLKINPGLTVEIQGHTDSHGSDTYNLKLSEDRANAVKQHIIDHGINASRLTTKGFGMSQPIASNDTDKGRAENRRVVFKRTDM